MGDNNLSEILSQKKSIKHNFTIPETSLMKIFYATTDFLLIYQNPIQQYANINYQTDLLHIINQLRFLGQKLYLYF